MPSFMISPLVVPGVTNNILAGSAFEFAPRDEKVAIAVTMPLGIAPGVILATVMFGSDVQAEDASVPVEIGPLDSGPQIPQNIFVDDVAAAGDRLVVRINNTTAGNVQLHAIVRILPI